MPQYRFRAVNTLGQVMKGRMDAANENHLAERLAGMGYELIVFRARQRIHWFRHWRGEQGSKQRVLLFTQLAALAKAGVPLVTCLEDTVVAMPDSALRDAVREVTRQVRDGADFAAACARHRDAFSPTVTALLQAGLAGGDLAAAFAHARDHVAWQAELGATLRRTLRYPLFLLALTGAAIAFMMLMVVPQLTQFLAAQNTALSWSTRSLIWLSEQFVTLLWAVPLVAAGGFLFVTRLRLRSAGFALRTDGMLLRLPLIGKIAAAVEKAHFLHHLALMIAGGVPLLPSLQGARSALTNRALARQADAMIGQLADGKSLADAMRTQPDFSGMIARRAQIGLQGDDLAGQLLQTSKDYDAEAMTRGKQLVASIEPALTMTVGLLLIWIVLAVLTPLYGSLKNLGYAH
ncbi:MAG: type II secretion system F family protein [Alphaproteobacteria bacterium]